MKPFFETRFCFVTQASLKFAIPRKKPNRQTNRNPNLVLKHDLKIFRWVLLKRYRFKRFGNAWWSKGCLAGGATKMLCLWL
jgi:hypothetical protein